MRTHWTDTAAPTRSLKLLSGRVSSRLGHFYKGYLVFLFSSRHWTGIIKQLNIIFLRIFCLIVLEVLHIFLILRPSPLINAVLMHVCLSACVSFRKSICLFAYFSICLYCTAYLYFSLTLFCRQCLSLSLHCFIFNLIVFTES